MATQVNTRDAVLVRRSGDNLSCARVCATPTLSGGGPALLSTWCSAPAFSGLAISCQHASRVQLPTDVRQQGP
eukprot:CAMPEP_0202911512 /NCGR_PEP_ID=MMETSP1392-20130828/55178_1 /ASSEMBLY_ACC=CAM_ASM_000868 /TAXON_ID=225041 /ORGANISM="Chlamydomonas chlamydogama, Strain SAG 11-48b" /LENGTH=72 /DNA_ID=CAMNT_0049602049 /DNA_START=170 /DNA_END=384 /DNA_ORIENTATION=-